MRKILTLLILLSLFMGIAGAATVTVTKKPTANLGAAQGFKNLGTIQGGDLSAVKNLTVGHDAEVLGTLYVGILSSGANVTSGHLTADVIVDDLADITAATGAERFDYSASTAAFSTGKGTNTLNGNVVIAGSKTVTSGTGIVNILGNMIIPGTKTFQMGTGTAILGGTLNAAGALTAASIVSNTTLDVNGATTAENISLTQGKRVTFDTAGLEYIYHDTGSNLLAIMGGPYFLEGAHWTGTLAPTSGSDLIATGSTSDIDYSLSSGFMKTPTGAITMSGATTWLANNGIAYTAGTGAADFSLGTGVFKTTTGAVTIGPGLITMSGGLAYPVNVTTTLNTILTSANTKTVYPMDGSGGSVMLTLPDPTTVTGRVYIIAVAADMVANNIVVADTGAGKIGGAGGADTLTSTDAAAALTVISTGTHYLVTSKVGTWT